jgi:hypothetical protein
MDEVDAAGRPVKRGVSCCLQHQQLIATPMFFECTTAAGFAETSSGRQ